MGSILTIVLMYLPFAPLVEPLYTPIPMMSSWNMIKNFEKGTVAFSVIG